MPAGKTEVLQGAWTQYVPADPGPGFYDVPRPIDFTSDQEFKLGDVVITWHHSEMKFTLVIPESWKVKLAAGDFPNEKVERLSCPDDQKRIELTVDVRAFPVGKIELDMPGKMPESIWYRYQGDRLDTSIQQS